MIRLPVCACLVLVALAPSAKGQGAAPDSVRRLIPADVMIHLELRPRPLLEKGGDLALAHIYREKEVQEFLAPLMSQLHAHLESVGVDVQQASGLGLEDLEPLLQQTLTVSMVPNRSATVVQDGDALQQFLSQIVLTLGLGEAEGAVRAALPRLEELVSKALGVSFRDSATGPLPVRGFPASKGSPGVYYAIHDGTLLLSFGRESLDTVAVLATGEGKCLADHAAFREVADQVFRPDSVLFAYLDAKGFASWALRDLPEETRDAFNFWGLGAYRTVGYGLELDGPGFRDRMHTRLTDPTGWASGRYRAEARLRSLDFAPADSGLFSAGLVDLVQLYDGIFKMLDEGYPRLAESMRRGVGEVDIQLGFNLRDDLLGILGPEYGFYASWPGQAVIPDLALFVQVPPGARAKVEEILDRVRSAVASRVTFRSVPFGKRTFEYLDLSTLNGGSPPSVGRNTIRPAFAFVDDWFVVTLWPQSLKNLMAGLDAKTPRLSSVPDFTNGLRRLAPQGDEASVVYMDLRRMTGFLLENAAPLVQSLVPTPGMGLDLGAWPSTECITRHLFGAVAVSRWTKEGDAISETTSPVGTFVTYGFAAGVMASLLLVGDEATVSGSVAPLPGFSVTPPAPTKLDATAQVHQDLRAIGTQLQAFRAWEGRTLREEEWPKVLLEGSPNYPDPYFDRIPTDPWDRPYVYRLRKGMPTLLTFGADGKLGGDGDDADITIDLR